MPAICSIRETRSMRCWNHTDFQVFYHCRTSYIDIDRIRMPEISAYLWLCDNLRLWIIFDNLSHIRRMISMGMSNQHIINLLRANIKSRFLLLEIIKWVCQDIFAFIRKQKTILS